MPAVFSKPIVVSESKKALDDACDALSFLNSEKPIWNSWFHTFCPEHAEAVVEGLMLTAKVWGEGDMTPYGNEYDALADAELGINVEDEVKEQAEAWLRENKGEPAPLWVVLAFHPECKYSGSDAEMVFIQAFTAYRQMAEAEFVLLNQ
jgi:hypothetical protein